VTPHLVALRGSFSGRTPEEALDQFERATSDEAYDSVEILAHDEKDGLAHYQVRWRHSVFDDYAYGSHESWARLEKSPSGFRVVAASAAHHNLEMQRD
jgi:hypothetical protein